MTTATLRELLHNHPWAERVTVLECIDSTNTFAKKLAASGAPHGTVVLANSQTAGRGRLGRSFYSPADEGLYLSLILRPEAPPERFLHLTAMAAVAACDAVEEVCKIKPHIKWPNDLVFGTRKLAGILCERTDAVIVGIGINLTQTEFPPELRDIATSVLLSCGKAPNRAELAAALIRAFSRMDEALFSQKAQWMQKFSENCATLGKSVQLVRGESVRDAFAESVTEDGALIVRLADGTREQVTSGEVSVRGFYGCSDV